MLVLLSPHLHPALGMYCHKAAGISLDQKARAHLPLCLHPTALSSNSVMVFFTLLYIQSSARGAVRHPQERRVMRKVWVTYRAEKCRWAACSQQPPEGEGRCPLHSLSHRSWCDWLTRTQGWILFGKTEFSLPLSWAAESRGKWSSQQWVAPGPQLKGGCWIDTYQRRKRVSSPTSWTPSERKAEGIGMLLSLTGVDILNVSWSEVSLRKGTNLDA